MFEVMLCGAYDVGNIEETFSEVVQGFGATPWWYSDGRILYRNSRHSRWEDNSKATVRNADICVFVILEEYGEITWTTELQEALNAGKQFAVLVLDTS